MAKPKKSQNPKPKNIQRKSAGMKRPVGMSKIDWRDLAWLIAKCERQNVSK